MKTLLLMQSLNKRKKGSGKLVVWKHEKVSQLVSVLSSGNIKSPNIN